MISLSQDVGTVPEGREIEFRVANDTRMSEGTTASSAIEIRSTPEF
jgi:hypothetical protein